MRDGSVSVHVYAVHAGLTTGSSRSQMRRNASWGCPARNAGRDVQRVAVRKETDDVGVEASPRCPVGEVVGAVGLIRRDL